MNRKIGVFLSYVLMIFEVLSTLLLTPFIIRTLGQAEYGVYKLAAAINAYLLLLDLGVGNAVTRYVAKFRVNDDREQASKFLGIATVFYLVIAVIAILLGIILVAIFPGAFSTGLNSDEIVLGQRLLSISMINTAVTLGTAAYTNVLIAYEKFAVSRGSSILQIVVRVLLTYVALVKGMGAIGIVLVNLLMTVCCRGFFVFYVLFKIKLIPCFKNIEVSFVKEIVAYSSLILLQMIATQLNSTVDQIMIGALVPASAVILAIYGVGTQIVQYFQSIGLAFNGVLMPGIVKLVEQKASAEMLTNEMIRIGRIILMMLALIWSGFLVLGRQFIVLWAGKSNEDAYIVALILMTAYMFILTESVGTQILWAMNSHKEQSYLKMAIVLANIFLTALLIKWKPLIGATIGTFISLALGDVGVMNYIFIKKIGVHLGYYYRGLLRGILPSAVISIVIGLISYQFISNGWLALLVNGCLMTAVYSLFMWIFGMNRYEKALVKSLIMSFLNKIGKS